MSAYRVTVLRLHDDGDTTLDFMYINGIGKCGAIEDQQQDVKVAGETRIPSGIYRLGLRREGGFHNRYAAKYGDWHRGMICIYNKDNWVIEKDGMKFQYCLFHTGNTDDHTAGCLLPNFTLDFLNSKGGRSGDAYKFIYPEICDAIEAYEAGSAY